MRRVLAFVDVPFSEDVLHHHEQIGKEVDLNSKEYSASQVKQKLYLESLTSWHGCIAEEILEKAGSIAPMLSKILTCILLTTPVEYILLAILTVSPQISCQLLEYLVVEKSNENERQDDIQQQLPNEQQRTETLVQSSGRCRV
ncbi:hypothetical protein WR25_08929 [Diploscapter pachys]|uniref:Protein-tyrosine sulfotransferase n=1 Tax=Diploscapter pachys TaxID=2018661 RepID=A0A2A2LS83_9BILA|nr:hypothetical protein WR25_08929 [Diploscapter pachys]